MELIDYKTAHSDIGVLLVEDDPESAALTRAKVSEDQDSSFRVEWTDDLQTAMSRLAKPGIDVILLDFGMLEPGDRKSQPPIKKVVEMKIPVVILTSDESTLSRHLTLGQGAANYLVKRRTSSAELRHALHEAVSLPR
jgi:DNA-binding response OmpR family regulator